MTDPRRRAGPDERNDSLPADRAYSSRARGTLVMLRHGRTTWNDESRFTGWADPPLNERGVREALRAGDVIAAAGLNVSVVFTSRVARALDTATIVMSTDHDVPVEWQNDWRLNERHFGLLQGLDRATAIARYGRDSVRHWKRDRNAVPPAVPEYDERHPRHDQRYGDVSPESLPGAESIADHERRVLACWFEVIEPRLEGGEDVLVVGHCHSLRALARFTSADPGCATDSLFAQTGGAVMTRAPGLFIALEIDHT